MHKTLTIGIPTYNGASHIRDALESVCGQASEDLVGKIEVLVSDNASTDETQTVVENYARDHPGLIRYRRNQSNVGFDQNVDALFKDANGKYVWLIGDDDALYEGVLGQVVKLLENDEGLAAVQVNFDKYDPTLKTVLEKVDISRDLHCIDGNTFLQNAKGRWGAIAALVVNRDAWNGLDLSNAIGSQIIFAYGLFRIVLEQPSLIIAQPMVKVRDGSEKAVARGDGDARVRIALASGALFRDMLRMGYRRDVLVPVLAADRRYAYEALPLAKFWGIRDKFAVARKYVEIHNSPMLWIKWLPLLFLPDGLYRPAFRLRMLVSSKTKPLERKLKKYLRTEAGAK